VKASDKTLKWSLTIIATLIDIFLIYKFVPLGEIYRNLKKIPPQLFLISLFLYGLSYLFRTFRWKYYYPRVGLRELFFTTSVNTFLNNLLPARLGELSIFALLRKYDKNLTETGKKFLKVRLLDAISLISFFLFAYLSIKLNPSIGALIGISVYPLAVFTVQKFPLPEKFPKPNWEPIPFLLSLGALFSKLVAVYLILRYLNLDFFKFTVGFLGGEVSTILPIHSFAGLGTYEASFSVSLKLFLGEDFKRGMEVAFVSHAFLLTASAIFGLLSLIALLRKKRF
jgi:uncharacterized membrane protein YbhN (UPF0104 family)